MTKLLAEALRRIDRLPAAEQDAVARIVIDELDSEQRWSAQFSSSQNALAALAGEASDEYRRGEAQPLDPDAL